MTKHPTSGCGPGIPRPADTPQQGVRSVRVRNKAYTLFGLYVKRQSIAEAFGRRVNLTDDELQEIARQGQAIADMAMGAVGE